MTVRSITRCNRLFSAKTANPLVGMLRLSDTDDIRQPLRFGFYTVWLRGWSDPCPALFGRRACDFSDGTLTLLPPGRSVEPGMWRSGSGQPEGRLLCFHASVFDPLETGRDSGGYSFFKYDIGESLHLSCREKAVLEREMDEIDEELSWGVDEYCHAILAGRIRLLLDYASRFYGRQFILRHDENQAVLDCTDRRLGTFFRSGKAPHERLPSAEDFAGFFGCSPAYFNDLLKHETGKDTARYVAFRELSCAGEALCRGTARPE